MRSMTLITRILLDGRRTNVDSLNSYLVADETRIWAQSFATCAIEGNNFAIYMTELWNKDKRKFEKELLEWLAGSEQNESP